MTLFGNRVLTDVINLKTSRCDQPGFLVGLEPNHWCLWKRKEGGFDIQRQGVKATCIWRKSLVMVPQARACQGHQKLKETRKGSHQSV